MDSSEKPDKIKPFPKKGERACFFITSAPAYASFGATALFALYNGFFGIRLLSIWHGGICVFYLLLAAVRGMILLTERNNGTRDDKQKSRCRRRTFIISSFILLLLNLALALPISLMVMLKKPVNTGLIPAIAMAAYTTYKLAVACVHIQRQKRSNHNNILISELRTINLIDALVSVLTLQNTLIMVKQTSRGGSDMLVLSAVSSAMIYAVIVLATVRLIIKGLKEKRAG